MADGHDRRDEYDDLLPPPPADGARAADRPEPGRPGPGFDGNTGYAGYDGQTGYGGYGDGPSTPGRGIAIGALVTGIVSIVLGLVPVLPILLGIVACVLGIVGMRRLRILPELGRGRGRGIAVGGIVTGAIGTILGVVAGIVWIAVLLFSAASSDDLARCASLPTQAEQQQCLRDLVQDGTGESGDSDAPAPADRPV